MIWLNLIFNNDDNVNNSVYSRYNDGSIPGFKDDIKELGGKFAAVDVTGSSSRLGAFPSTEADLPITCQSPLEHALAKL